ncbi:lysis system i-spanin subunit Rz [Andreprevotia chitinilytica]|uniref:lysis system i-spanin subunit Rz n=1 Tax=Andreprevotia chitinilytica TaxID=396808 RepID=UPI00054F7576|nr:lysis system i-spanin subunit Rz [Andreprevotia chitinilytica]
MIAIPWYWRWLAITALVAAFAAFFYGQGEQHESVRRDLIDAGRDAADAKRETTNAKALADAQTHARALEHDAADQMARIGNRYQEQLRDETTRRDRLITDLRAGTLRLSVPIRTASTQCLPATTDTGPGSDGAALAELQDAAAEFLIHLADEADRVVDQLDACQAVIVADRAVRQGSVVQREALD